MRKLIAGRMAFSGASRKRQQPTMFHDAANDATAANDDAHTKIECIDENTDAVDDITGNDGMDYIADNGAKRLYSHTFFPTMLLLMRSLMTAKTQDWRTTRMLMVRRMARTVSMRCTMAAPTMVSTKIRTPTTWQQSISQ